MVWNYLFAGDDERSFDPALLQNIKEKNNEQVESSLQNAENLSTAVDSSGASLLHYSAEYGNEVITQLLIKLAAKVDLQNEKGQTPLMLATTGEHEETIRVLLENDADIYIVDKKGVNSLQLAVEETLILPSIIDMFFAQMKTTCSSVDIGRRLLKVNCPLYIAARLKDLDIVKHMLSENSPIDAVDLKTNQTALHVAVQNGDVEMVKLLINQGSDVNALDAQKQSPLSLIRTFEQTEMLEILVAKNVDLTACTEDGIMQIYWVLTSGTTKAVKVILQSGIDVQAKDSHEQTIMHYLAKNTNEGVIEIVEEWIDHDEIYNKISNRIKRKFDFIVDYSETILSKSIDWNARDKDAKTPLHNAIAAGNVSFVEYLIKKEADVNVKTTKEVTPFFEALESSTESTLEHRVECVKLIMENGGYPDVDIERYLKIYNTKSAINRDFALLEPVVAHLILRQAKGERISEELLESINCHQKLKEYVAACREELNHMKNLKISKKFTVFHFLIEVEKRFSFYDSALYLNINENVKKHNFDSYYSSLLQQRFSVLFDDLMRISRLVILIVVILFGIFLSYILPEDPLKCDSDLNNVEFVPKIKSILYEFVQAYKTMITYLIVTIYLPLITTLLTYFVLPSKKPITSTS